MIQKFLDKFMENKHKLEEYFSQNHPDDYEQIVKKTMEVISDDKSGPNHNIIHSINDFGSCEGDFLYIIPDKQYYPEVYYYVFVVYGSCSGCDTLEGIQSNGKLGEKPNKQQVDDYISLSLHIVQSLKPMG